jgi:ABC-type nitrate/sulfonate/bicarbonate transport system substrate-binding protein
MKRREFLQASALAGLGAVAAPSIARAAENPGKIKVGHLVGICMSPLFYAHAKDMFKGAGLDVEIKFLVSPGDNLVALGGGEMHIIHNPFTNSFVAGGNGMPIRLIAGSGGGGVAVVAGAKTGIKTMEDLKKAKGKGLKIGVIRANTLELTFYRAAKNNGLSYDDFNMVYFTDTLSMAAAFEAGAIDIACHVEPFTTAMIDKQGGASLVTNVDVWGKSAPDCVVNTTADYLAKYPETLKTYIKVLLDADKAIMTNLDAATDVLDAGKYYRVDKPTLRASLPRQPPLVDLSKGGEAAMDIAIKDLAELGYIKSVPNIVDLSLLRAVA